MGTATSPLCKLCNQSSVSTITHTFIDCPVNADVGKKLLACLHVHTPNISPESLLRVEIARLEEEITITLSFIWNRRMTNSKFRAYQVRSEIEQTINLLRTSRIFEVSAKLQTLLNQMFQ